MRLLLLLVLLGAPASGQRGRRPLEPLQETGKMEESKSGTWWLNSGAYFFPGRFCHTVLGNLPENDKWRLLYNRNNPLDTDNGFHPQNIFRLINRLVREDYSQQVYFWIEKSNLSQSPNRNESNGVLLLNRWQDNDNLYYAGLRVNGRPVIKKKYKGAYTTLAYPAAVYPGHYDRSSSPNLLPEKQWLGLKTTVKTEADKSLAIRLYLDLGQGWQLAAEAKDKGKTAGGPFGPGRSGIRTDFMDIRFRDYRLD